MSYHQQYQDRVRQALATDAQAAGTTIGEMDAEQRYYVAREIHTLYPHITPGVFAETLNRIHDEERATP